MDRRAFIRASLAAGSAAALADLAVPPGQAAAAPASAAPAGRLRANDLDNPLGIDVLSPMLTWQISGSRRNQAQRAYQVLVASSLSLLDRGSPDLWDSGKVISPQSVNVGYAGLALESRARAYWKVRIWDDGDRALPWSEPAHWEMGLLNPDDWQASWLVNQLWLAAHTDWPGQMPLFATTFTLDRPVARARLYAVGLGGHEARLNGEKIGSAVLEPSSTDFSKRVRYTTYDVTSRLRQGPNTLGFMLGNGIYNVPPSPGRYNSPNGLYPDNANMPRGKTAPLKLIAQLEVTYTDGSAQTVVTDGSWRTALGPITFSGWYGGEDYDARLEIPGWDSPGADLGTWDAAVTTGPPAAGAVLSAQEAPPLRVQQTLTAVSRTQAAPDVWLYDLGRNFSGFPQVTVAGAAGQTLKISPSEQLIDGRVNRDPISQGLPVYFSYTPAADEVSTWHPRFSYDGFRWVEISGLTSPLPADAVKGLVVRADNPQTGSFECSDVLLNRVHELFVHALQSNMYSDLTDCPHREKGGWNEEKHLLFNGVAGNFDVAAYYRQIMTNVLDDQLADGDIPRLTPNYRGVPGWDPYWSTVVIQAPWKMYQAYGDVQILRDALPAMQRHLAYLSGQAQGNILPNLSGYGDWGAPDTRTPLALTGTVGYYQAAATLEKIASVLGDTSAAATYGQLASDITSAFTAEFFDPATHSYGPGSQAANALPLAAGMVAPAEQAAVLANVIADIRSRDSHLSTGEIGLRALLDALGDAGRSDVVLEMVLNATVPSSSGVDVDSGYAGLVLGTPVAVGNASDIPWTGQTTMTELWNPDGASRNHWMLGAVDDWCYRYLAGIRPAAPGFQRFTVAPEPAGTLSHVRAAWPSPYGQIVSEWTRHGAAFGLDVQVPGNTTATVAVPFAGNGPVHATGGAKRIRVDGGRAYYAVGSGHWSFAASTGEPAAPNQVPVYVGSVSTSVQVLSDPSWEGTAEFRLHNLGSKALTVRPALSVPDGFTAAADQDTVAIPAQGSVSVTVTVSAAAAAGAAGGNLTLRVEDSAASVPVTALDTSNFARVATMTASSSHDGHAPEAASNGDTSSDTWDSGNGWNDGTENVWPDWLAASWNQGVTLGRVRVYNLDSAKYPAVQYANKDFDIQLLTDGAWTTVDQVRDNATGLVEAQFDPVTATAVRVYVLQGGGAWSRVIELEAYSS